jgi:hypothetical protein
MSREGYDFSDLFKVFRLLKQAQRNHENAAKPTAAERAEVPKATTLNDLFDYVESESLSH